MCGRYSLTARRADLAGRFSCGDGLAEVGSKLPHYNLAPAQLIPVITADAVGGRRWVAMRWGYLPDWAPSAAERGHINARIESVAQKPTFRRQVDIGRVLIPADSFYEWSHDEGRPKPWRFFLRSREIFAFAGIRNRYRAPGGHMMDTVAILTTPSGGPVAAVHERMPVMVPRNQEARWLDAAVAWRSLGKEGFEPVNGSELEGGPVGLAVNSPSADGPECWAPPLPELFD